MVEKTDGQVDAALSAAKARQAIAQRIRKLVPGIQKVPRRRKPAPPFM